MEEKKKKKKIKIEKIIDMEWQMFQKVENIGGRASCQDDFETFYIMRFSQYGSWTEEMVDFYLDFAEDALRRGRNLVSEKYARMMEFTHPEYYKREIEPLLPPISAECLLLIDKIAGAMVGWETEFSRLYPKLSGAGRPITSEDDASGFTSMETYARGELSTYPVELLRLYSEYIDRLLKEGKSLSIINQQIMVELYGYDTIKEAEDSL